MKNTATILHLGLDVGSTTVKAVVMDPTTKGLLFSRYLRHNAYQSETLCGILKEIAAAFPDALFRAAVCGSGGKPLSDALYVHFVQEVVANAIAVRTFYPAARVAVELGGQDAKVVFFHHDETANRLVATDMRMNGSCAGGTGAFIDEVATLLRTAPEDFEALASKGNAVYDISGRCGVFAKTDIQPLLNQGCLKENIALSTFHAIAKQTIGGLAQGLELRPPIVFEGGPLTFNPTLIKVFAQRLGLGADEIIRPDKPETLIAYGAALSLDDLFADDRVPFDIHEAVKVLGAFRDRLSGAAGTAPDAKRVYFSSASERAAFLKRHRLPPVPCLENALYRGRKLERGDVLPVYIGIDAGSTTTKFVFMDEEENVVDVFCSNNKGEPLRVIKDALLAKKRSYDKAGITLKIIALGTTGYGELLFDKALGADYHTVETVAHATAARKYVPDVTFILDIGGQDMKSINVSNGVVTNITLNEACSSGCGSFLENFAANLNIPIDGIASSAFDSENPAELGSRCTVFMNSTIITEQKNGKKAGDIMAGLCRSIVENVFTKVVRLSNFDELGDRVVVQGGTFKNDAVLRALEQYIGKEVTRAPYPGEMGAIGIALLTKQHIGSEGYTSPHGPSDCTRFLGFDALSDFDYTQETNIRCTFCANNCNRTLITFSNGTTWVTGNRCERGELVGDLRDPDLQKKVREISAALDAVPDMIKVREQLLFKDYSVSPVCDARDTIIGLPRVLDFWRTMPFFTTFFRALGFTVRISRPSSRALYERGIPFVASDTVCFPAKLAHGHIHDLMDDRGAPDKKVDRIFLPLFSRLQPDNPSPVSNYTCPVLKGYPLVVKYSDNPERRWNTPMDTPVFHWFTNRDRNFQLSRYVNETFGISEGDSRKAIEQGDAALKAFNDELVSRGAEIIAATEKAGNFAVVLSGRHYQFDELVNHQLSRYFTGVGIPVLTVDSLPGIQEVDLSKTMLDITNNNHARLLAGAIFTAEHPALEYVEIFNFGCGHDALYTDEVTRLLSEISGKSPLILKLDESDVAGPLRIRVRSFIETVQSRRSREQMTVTTLGDPFSVKFTKKDRKLRTILVPNVSRAFCLIMTGVLRRRGLRAAPLPIGNKDAMQCGKQYVHNDACFPAQIVIGEAIAALKSGAYNPEDVIVGTGKTMCDCRLTNYMTLTRNALDKAGYPEVPIFDTDFMDAKNLHPGFRFAKLDYAYSAWCFIMADALGDLVRKIRPYERCKGETNRVLDESIQAIAEGIDAHGIRGTLSAFKKAIDRFCGIEYDRSTPRPVVFITGEYLLTFHPGSNYYIEDYLEKNGMEVELPKMYDIYRNLMISHTVSEIKDFHVRHPMGETLYAFGGERFFEVSISAIEHYAKKHPLYEPAMRLPEAAKMTDHIIHHSIQSGEGFLMAADIIHRAKNGVKSFVILQPFGCLPNHVCGRGMIKRIKEDFPGIQVLPLDYDPDTSFANIENRLQMLIMNTKGTNFQEGSAP